MVVKEEEQLNFILLLPSITCELYSIIVYPIST